MVGKFTVAVAGSCGVLALGLAALFRSGARVDRRICGAKGRVSVAGRRLEGGPSDRCPAVVAFWLPDGRMVRARVPGGAKLGHGTVVRVRYDPLDWHNCGVSGCVAPTWHYWLLVGLGAAGLALCAGACCVAAGCRWPEPFSLAV